VNAPAGNHIARLYSITHIGNLDENYMGEPKVMDKVRLGFELPTETHVFKEGEEAKPLSVFEEYTFSMHEKAKLRKLVHGILGTQLCDAEAAAFDLDDLLGQVCMLNVTLRDSGWPKIESAAPLPKGMKAPEQVNQNFIFDVDEFDQEKFDTLPKFVQDKISSSYNYKNEKVEKTSNRVELPDNVDGIPF
jgi:hypothetical protein